MIKQILFASVPYNERRSIAFNALGFLFGPFYYLSKGMWRKAITYFSAAVACLMILSMVIDLLGFSDISKFLGYGVAGVFAVRVNIDYYKKMVLDENGWW